MTGTSRALFGGYVLLVALAAPVALSGAQDGETEAPATSGGAVTAPPASEGEAAASEPEAAAATSAAKQATHEVLMRDIEFVPKTITVDAGDTVTWRNEDSEPHNAIANDNSVFSTETIQQGETVSATIGQAGTIPYFCSIHAGMKGTVRALGGGSGGGGSGGGSGGGGSGGGSGDSGSPGGSSDDFLDPSATPPAGSGSAAGSSGSAGSDAGLPATGSDSVWLALAGAWLLSVGAAIRAAVSGASR